MSRGEILLPLACLILLGGVVLVFSRRDLRPETKLAAVVEPMIDHPGRSVAEFGARTVPPAVKSKPLAQPRFNATPKSVEVPEIASDAAQTSPSSWENPFSPELWHSTGWNFTSQSMRATGTEQSSATFHRPYHKLMFECDIIAAEAPGSMWELRLSTRNAQVVMSLILSDGQLSVVTIENGLAQVAVEKRLTAPLTSKAARQLRVVATGNRIVVSWDGKRFLATEQLAAQSGREIVWSIHTSGAAYEIPRLRVEGD